MSDRYGWLIVIILGSAVLYSCTASNVGSAVKNETVKMKIQEQRNVIDPEKLPVQMPLSMGERALVERGETRSIISPIAGSVVSMATDALKKIIANDKKKYTATYRVGLTDLYFYDQLSNEGPFDPAGMQFSGFKIIRTFVNKAGNTDTALTAEIILDTTNISETVNNSVFRLRLKSFDLRYAKAKVGSNQEKKLNMDFEITFITSYANDQGQLYDSVVLGKFYLFVRNAPLEKSAPGYNAYYKNMEDSLLSGKSFIIPRSFGYHREPDGLMKPGYSQGAYSIQVKVKESSKNNFVTQLVFENANLMIDATRDQLKSKLKNL
jgi:hypothetical protein